MNWKKHDIAESLAEQKFDLFQYQAGENTVQVLECNRVLDEVERQFGGAGQ